MLPPRTWAQLTRFLTEQGGGIAPILGLAAIPLVAIVGVAVDYTKANSVKSAMQAAADVAALGAAAAKSEDTSARTVEAKKLFEAYLRTFIKVEPSVAFQGEKVTVTAAGIVPTSLMGIIRVNEIPVGATTTAVRLKGPPICVLALNPTAASAVAVQGQGKLRAPQCVVHANSTHSQALRMEGGATAVAEKFCGMGGYAGSGFSPQPTTGCPKVTDPFAGLSPPAKVSCDVIQKTLFNSGSSTILPGVYCGGLEVEAGATLNLSPGV